MASSQMPAQLGTGGLVSQAQIPAPSAIELTYQNLAAQQQQLQLEQLATIQRLQQLNELQQQHMLLMNQAGSALVLSQQQQQLQLQQSPQLGQTHDPNVANIELEAIMAATLGGSVPSTSPYPPQPAFAPVLSDTLQRQQSQSTLDRFRDNSSQATVMAPLPTVTEFAEDAVGWIPHFDSLDNMITSIMGPVIPQRSSSLKSERSSSLKNNSTSQSAAMSATTADSAAANTEYIDMDMPPVSIPRRSTSLKNNSTNNYPQQSMPPSIFAMPSDMLEILAMAPPPHSPPPQPLPLDAGSPAATLAQDLHFQNLHAQQFQTQQQQLDQLIGSIGTVPYSNLGPASPHGSVRPDSPYTNVGHASPHSNAGLGAPYGPAFVSGPNTDGNTLQYPNGGSVSPVSAKSVHQQIEELQQLQQVYANSPNSPDVVQAQLNLFTQMQQRSQVSPSASPITPLQPVSPQSPYGAPLGSNNFLFTRRQSYHPPSPTSSYNSPLSATSPVHTPDLKIEDTLHQMMGQLQTRSPSSTPVCGATYSPVASLSSFSPYSSIPSHVASAAAAWPHASQSNRYSHQSKENEEVTDVPSATLRLLQLHQQDLLKSSPMPPTKTPTVERSVVAMASERRRQAASNMDNRRLRAKVALGNKAGPNGGGAIRTNSAPSHLIRVSQTVHSTSRKIPASQYQGDSAPRGPTNLPPNVIGFVNVVFDPNSEVGPDGIPELREVPEPAIAESYFRDINNPTQAANIYPDRPPLLDGIPKPQATKVTFTVFPRPTERMLSDHAKFKQNI